MTTSVALLILLLFLAPLGYMFTTAIKSDTQMSDPDAPPFWPHSKVTFNYEGQELDVSEVPVPNGGTQELAALQKTRTQTTFIDPENPGRRPVRLGRQLAHAGSLSTSPMLSGRTSRRRGTT